MRIVAKDVLSKDILYKLIFEKNLTYKAIAEMYNFDQHTISSLAKEYNIPKNPKSNSNSHKKIHFDVDVITKMYVEQKMSIRDIAKHFKCQHNTISKFLKDNNIKIRSGYSKEYYNKRSKYQTHCDPRLNYVKIMEQHIGRRLTENEVVHHIDQDRSNNDISNLFLFENNFMHCAYHGYIENNQYIEPEAFVDKYGETYSLMLDYNFLKHEYIDLRKSANQISKENYPVSRPCIINLLKKLGIWDMRKPTVNQHN